MIPRTLFLFHNTSESSLMFKAYFTCACTHSIRMELWPGYITAIHEQDGGLLMCFDASHRLLRTDTALDHM